MNTGNTSLLPGRVWSLEVDLFTPVSRRTLGAFPPVLHPPQLRLLVFSFGLAMLGLLCHCRSCAHRAVGPPEYSLAGVHE